MMKTIQNRVTPPWWQPASWLRFSLTVWLAPRRYFEESGPLFRSGETRELLLQAGMGTVISTLLVSTLPVAALHLAGSNMGWPWMFAGVLIGLAVGIGTSLYLFTRSSIQPADLVFLGTFLGLLSGINFGFRLGFASGLRLDAAWGMGLGLLIGGLAAFTCGYREALAGSPEGSPRTRLLAFGLAPAATLFALDLDAVTIPAYFLALLAALVFALPAAQLGHGWFRWRMGDRR